MDKNIKLKITSLKTEYQRNRFKYASDNGQSYTEPYFFTLDIVGKIDGVDAYISHKIGCLKSTGFINGYSYEKEETDFIKITERQGELLRSTSPEMFPNAKAFEFKETIEIKIKEGQEIAVDGRLIEKTSKNGNKYFKLTHVKRAKND